MKIADSEGMVVTGIRTYGNSSQAGYSIGNLKGGTDADCQAVKNSETLKSYQLQEVKHDLHMSYLSVFSVWVVVVIVWVGFSSDVRRLKKQQKALEDRIARQRAELRKYKGRA